MKTIFEAAGFVCEHVLVHERDIENKGQGITMNRRWIQAEFKYVSVENCNS